MAKRAETKQRKTEIDGVLDDFERMLAAPTDGPDAVMKAARLHLEERRDARMTWIRSRWHNRPTGVLALVAVATALVAAVICGHLALRDELFDVIARLIALMVGTAVTVTLLSEDPFHEGLAPGTHYWLRLKPQGKVVGMLAVVGLLCAGLDVFAAVRAQATFEETLVKRVSERVDAVMDRLDPQLVELGAEVVRTRDELAEARTNVDGVIKSIALLRQELDRTTAVELARVQTVLAGLRDELGRVRQKLPKELVSKADFDDAIDPLATMEGVTTAVEKLATTTSLETTLTNAVAPLVTTATLAKTVDGLATKQALINATKDLVTSSELATQLAKGCPVPLPVPPAPAVGTN